MSDLANISSNQTASESAITTGTEKSVPISITVSHPRLVETDAESIRTFLRKYDKYCHEIRSRALQIAGGSGAADAVKPIDLKFCIDVEYLESSIALGFIPGVDSYETLTDTEVRNFLNSRAVESKEVVTLDKLDKIVDGELRTNMRNNNATARMKDLFASYYTILSRNGLKWIVTENQKVSVGHVLSAVRPVSLKERLESDLSFSHHHLKKDFNGFLAHAIKLAEAFQLVDCGPPSKRPKPGDGGKGRSGNHLPGDRDDKEGHDKKNSGGPNKLRDKKTPFCLWDPHKKKGIRHFLKDCQECPA